MIVKHKDKGFYMHKYYHQNLTIIRDEAIPNKWDALGIFFGKEGAGKSTLMLQTAVFYDENFSLDNIVFTPDQFMERVDDCPPKSAIVWDEAITGARANQHASDISMSIVSKLTQIRKKGLKIFIGFPYLNMLHKYFISRCLFSCYIYAEDFNKRGYAKFYSSNQTEALYDSLKETYRNRYKLGIARAKSSFNFNFTKYFPVGEEEYDTKKEEARTGNQVTDQLWKARFKQTLEYIKQETDGSIKQLASHLKMHPNSLYNIQSP